MKKKPIKPEKKLDQNISHGLMDDVPSYWVMLLIPCGLIGLTWLFYWASLSYNFQFDDIANITRSFHIRHGTLKKIFLSGPRWISYWLNALYYSIDRFNPFFYRLGNVSIHISTALILYFFVYYALKNLKNQTFFAKNAVWMASLTTGLFLLHPVQTQTVSYVIQGQLEGLAAFFSLLVAFLFMRSCQLKSGSWQKISMFLVPFAAFLACGTKEIAIVIPLLTLLTDWFFVAQGKWCSLKRRLWVHGMLGILVGGMYCYFLKPTFFYNVFGLKSEARNNIGNVLTASPQEKILPIPFFISQFKVIVHYLWIFVWPFSMSVEYDWKLVSGLFAPDCIFPLMFLLSCFGLLFFHLRKNSTSVLGFAALWFLIVIAPRSSIIPSSELLTDYKTYLASVGVLLLLSSLCVYAFSWVCSYSEFLRTNKQQCHLVALLLMLLPIGYATYSRNKIWRTAEEFWLDIIHHAPGKARAYNNYAVALSERGAHKEAIPYYQKAIAMDRNYPDPLNNIAVSYAVVDDLDRAIAALKQAIAQQPHYPEAYNNLASFLIRKNELDQAEKVLTVAIQLRPYYGKAYFNLGKIYLMRNEPDKAVGFFKKACLEADLDNEAGFKVYADVSLRLQRYDEAIVAYKKLIEIAPSSESYFGLANSYFLKNDYVASIEVYTTLTRLAPQEMKAWYNLGEAYVKIANFGMALTCFEKARTLPSCPPMAPLRSAFCLDSLGRRDEAIDLLEQTLALNTLTDPLKKTVEVMVMHMRKNQPIKA